MHVAPVVNELLGMVFYSKKKGKKDIKKKCREWMWIFRNISILKITHRLKVNILFQKERKKQTKHLFYGGRM